MIRAATPADEPFLLEMLRLAAWWRGDPPAPLTAEIERYARGSGGGPQGS